MAKSCKCSFHNNIHRDEELHDILSSTELGIPEDCLREVIDNYNPNKWAIACDCNDPNRIVATAHYKNNDWYLCTISNLITKTKFRGQGYGKQIIKELLNKIKKDPDCHVLAADIDFDNFASKAVFERLGFEEKTRFCWKKGEKPADVVHYVMFPPDKYNQCKRK